MHFTRMFSSMELKWLELSDIASNPDNFDKKFMNTFLKSIKMFMKVKNLVKIIQN